MQNSKSYKIARRSIKWSPWILMRHAHEFTYLLRELPMTPNCLSFILVGAPLLSSLPPPVQDFWRGAIWHPCQWRSQEFNVAGGCWFSRNYPPRTATGAPNGMNKISFPCSRHHLSTRKVFCIWPSACFLWNSLKFNLTWRSNKASIYYVTATSPQNLFWEFVSSSYTLTKKVKYS